MKIYTKTGDLGQTSLFGGGRVPKSHPRVRTYGTLDEANSTLGLAISFGVQSPSLERLTRIQNELFQLGAELATQSGAKNSCPLISETEIEQMEQEIDLMEQELQPLKNFILAGGCSAGAGLHLARTIVRRCERECVELTELRPEVIRYLNRLSDYLFVMARFVNHQAGQAETIWSVTSK